MISGNERQSSSKEAKTIPSIRRRSLIPLIVALVIGGAAAVVLSAATTPKREVLSFEMWCLDMQLYSPTRCDARRNEDIKDYERYRTSEEKFDQQRSDSDKRDQAILDRLKRDPVATKR